MERLSPLLAAALLLIIPAQANAISIDCSKLLQSDDMATVTVADLYEDEKGYLNVDALSFSSELNFAVNDAGNQTNTGPLSARTRARVADNGIAWSGQHRLSAHRVATNILTYAAVLNVRFTPNRDQINSANLTPYSDGWYYAYHHTRQMTWTLENLNLDGQHTCRFTMVQLA